MSVLWTTGALAPAEIHAALSATENVAYTTIHTELSRMLTKGIVKKSKLGKYEAALTREELSNTTVSSVLRDLIQAHGAAAVHGFIDLVEHDEGAMRTLRNAMRKRTKK